MKAILILLAIVMAILNAGADTYAFSSSTSSSVAIAGDITPSFNPIAGGTASSINSQTPNIIVSTAAETFTSGGATAVAEAISEAVATSPAGVIVRESSQSTSISVNGQAITPPVIAINTGLVDEIREEIEELQMSV